MIKVCDIGVMGTPSANSFRKLEDGTILTIPMTGLHSAVYNKTEIKLDRVNHF